MEIGILAVIIAVFAIVFAPPIYILFFSKPKDGNKPVVPPSKPSGNWNGSGGYGK